MGDSALPMIVTPTDARMAREQIMHDSALQQLVTAFQPGARLDRLRDYLELEALPSADASERSQIGRVLRSWADWEKTAGGTELQLPALRSGLVPWDMRCGGERDVIPVGVEMFPADIRELIMSIAGAWGMTEPGTPSGAFDVAVPLGGMVRANLSRPAYAAELAARVPDVSGIIGLAAHRKPAADEAALARRIGLSRGYEEDSLRLGLERAFGLDPATWALERVGLGAVERNINSLPVTLAIVPSSLKSGKRSTTSESFDWLRENHVLPDGGRVLQVTSPIYWFANHVAARTALPPTVFLETVGAPPSTGIEQSLPLWTFRSQHYLQELKSICDQLPVLEAWARAPFAT